MMKMSYRYFVPLLFCFSLEAHAAAEDGRLQAAMNLLESMDMRVNLARTVEQVTTAEVEKSPELVPYKGVMLEFMNRYMGFDNLKSDLAKLYADAFTKVELEELARFYQTPVGKKTLQQMPELTVRGGLLGQRKVEEHLAELEAMITQESQRIQTIQAK